MSICNLKVYMAFRSQASLPSSRLQGHITNVTMQSFLDDNYMILGKWIRNNWGFWTNSDLYKQLQKEYKVETPDAASILVLEKFYQHLLDKKN